MLASVMFDLRAIGGDLFGPGAGLESGGGTVQRAAVAVPEAAAHEDHAAPPGEL